MNILKNLMGPLARTLFLATAAPICANATILATTSFAFRGECDDCAGALVDPPLFHAINDGVYQDVTGTLVLQGFQPGVLLTNSNFVSFSYDGSSILKPFTVTDTDEFSIFGRLDASGVVSSTFNLFWFAPPELASTVTGLNLPCIGSCQFRVATNGNWQLGEVAADVGINGAFAVPEPSALMLLATGLAGLGVMRRRRTV